MLTKFEPESAVKAGDHLDNFYLQLQTLEVQYENVACRLFLCTLDGRTTIWYHNLPINSIHNWGTFNCIFLEKYVDDRTLAMFPKELGSLYMEEKEKVKYLNQRFLRIWNKFSADMKPHDIITVDYYTSTLPTSIVQFVKRAMKPTLLENCEEAIAVEKDLCAIGVIKDDEPTKDSRDSSKKPQAVASKGKDKDTSDIETLTRVFKNLTTKVSELKQRTIEMSVSSRSPRQRKGSMSSSRNRFSTKHS